jgi:hypothetical protein
VPDTPELILGRLGDHAANIRAAISPPPLRPIAE